MNTEETRAEELKTTVAKLFEDFTIIEVCSAIIDELNIHWQLAEHTGDEETATEARGIVEALQRFAAKRLIFLASKTAA